MKAFIEHDECRVISKSGIIYSGKVADDSTASVLNAFPLEKNRTIHLVDATFVRQIGSPEDPRGELTINSSDMEAVLHC